MQAVVEVEEKPEAGEEAPEPVEAELVEEHQQVEVKKPLLMKQKAQTPQPNLLTGSKPGKTLGTKPP
jgi:hypothetical protein